MAFIVDFDPKSVPPAVGFEPLPRGEYLCVMSSSEMKATSKGNGEYLALTFTVIEGQHADRKIFDYLNLVNPSLMTVNIARGTLSAICHAVGVLTPTDTSELHDRPLLVTVKIKDDRNAVTAYKPASGASAAPHGASAPAPASAAKAAPAKPWEKAKAA